MSAGIRASVAGPSSSSVIPANARKVVQDLTEIVKNSEEEIYAMLKECNMDPNETVQRLLYQDTFHEVKRKRDKRKEIVSKDSGEPRARSSGTGSFGRGGRGPDRGTGRGSYMPRFNPDSNSGGRGQGFNGRDNGPYQHARDQGEWQGQSKTDSLRSGSNAMVPGVPNGGSQYVRPRGNWGTGSYQAAMAHARSTSTQQNADAPPSSARINGQQVSKVSDVDPDVQFPTDSNATTSLGANQGSRAAENEQENILIPPTEAIMEPDIVHQVGHPSSREVQDADADSSLTSAPASLSASDGSGSFGGALPLPSLGLPVGIKATAVASQSNGRIAYQTQHQALGGHGLEWRPKSPLNTTESLKSLPLVSEPIRSSPTSNQEDTMLPTSKLEKLCIADDQPVIIPAHLQVPEADRTHLNFGSFGDDFDTIYTTTLTEDGANSAESAEENIPETELLVEQPIASSLMGPSGVALEHDYTTQPTPSEETLASNDDVAISLPSPAISPVLSRPDVLKSESLTQQSSQHPYLSSLHNYPGLGTVPQLVGGNQYAYEPPEPQPQEVSRLPGFVSPYSDPVANYYSPILRPGSDVDSRYSHMVSNATNKYSPGVAVMTGQGLSSSQEAVIPATGPAVQTSQAVGVAQTGLTIPQQPIPIHAYPAQHAGLPLTPFTNVFGFQYLPSSYGYVPAPYQHNFVGNTGYPQAPGSSYGPAASAYAPTGAAAIKYSLPQYKPGVAAAGNAPLAGVAAAYGSFGTSPGGFATGNPASTSAPASGYDDVNGSQFKESSLYIPNQQAGDGSTVWVQTQLSRDMTGMQANSYYNVLGQGQHSGFTHTQPMHAVPAAGYASLYHQSQSGTAPTIHTLLQQPQALGAVGAVANQSGAYQQPQRGQLSWANNY